MLNGVHSRRYAIGVLALLLIAGPVARLRSTTTRAGLLDDVASPYRWCDAADVYEERGDGAKAVYAYDRALLLGPRDAAVLLRAANFDLARDNVPAALRKCSRLLLLTPDSHETVFGTYLGMNLPIADILQYGLPHDRHAEQAFFDWLLSHKVEPAGPAFVWERLKKHHFEDEKLAEHYTAYLFQAHEYEDAARVWAEVVGPYPPANRVFNGGFERTPLHSPLDWLIESAQAERDRGVAQSGESSLRIQFSGLENIDFQHVRQDLVVVPGVYRFSAFVKTDGLTTDQGIVFHIFDPERPERLNLWTNQFTGTQDWTYTAESIRVLAQTRLLRIQISRRASKKLDNKVAGTAWIDSVSLIPAAS